MRCSLVVIDQLISAWKQHLETYKEINNKFVFLSKLASLSICEIKLAAGNLSPSCPNDLEPTIESEFIQFSTLLASSTELQTSHKQTKPAELRMYRFLHTHTLPHPNIS